MADEQHSPASSISHRYNLRHRESHITPSNSVSTKTQRRPRTTSSSVHNDSQPSGSITHWRKDDLVNECAKRELPTEGTRADLIARISASNGGEPPSSSRRPSSRASTGVAVETRRRKSRRQTAVSADTAFEETGLSTPVARSARARKRTERPATGRMKGVPPIRTPATRTMPRRMAASVYRRESSTAGAEPSTPLPATNRKLEMNTPVQSKRKSRRTRPEASFSESIRAEDAVVLAVEGTGSETGSVTKPITGIRDSMAIRPVSATLENSTAVRSFVGDINSTSIIASGSFVEPRLTSEKSSPSLHKSTETRPASDGQAMAENKSKPSLEEIEEENSNEDLPRANESGLPDANVGSVSDWKIDKAKEDEKSGIAGQAAESNFLDQAANYQIQKSAKTALETTVAPTYSNGEHDAKIASDEQMTDVLAEDPLAVFRQYEPGIDQPIADEAELVSCISGGAMTESRPDNERSTFSLADNDHAMAITAGNVTHDQHSDGREVKNSELHVEHNEYLVDDRRAVSCPIGDTASDPQGDMLEPEKLESHQGHGQYGSSEGIEVVTSVANDINKNMISDQAEPVGSKSRLGRDDCSVDGDQNAVLSTNDNVLGEQQSDHHAVHSFESHLENRYCPITDNDKAMPTIAEDVDAEQQYDPSEAKIGRAMISTTEFVDAEGQCSPSEPKSGKTRSEENVNLVAEIGEAVAPAFTFGKIDRQLALSGMKSTEEHDEGQQHPASSDDKATTSHVGDGKADRQSNRMESEAFLSLEQNVEEKLQAESAPLSFLHGDHIVSRTKAPINDAKSVHSESSEESVENIVSEETPILGRRNSVGEDDVGRSHVGDSQDAEERDGTPASGDKRSSDSSSSRDDVEPANDSQKERASTPSQDVELFEGRRHGQEQQDDCEMSALQAEQSEPGAESRSSCDMSISADGQVSLVDEQARFSSDDEVEDAPDISSPARNGVIEIKDDQNEELVIAVAESMDNGDNSSCIASEEVDEHGSIPGSGVNEIIDIDDDSGPASREESGSNGNLTGYDDLGVFSDGGIDKFEVEPVNTSTPAANHIIEPEGQGLEEQSDRIVQNGAPPVAAPTDGDDSEIVMYESAIAAGATEQERGAVIVNEELLKGRSIVGVKRSRKCEDDDAVIIGNVDVFQSTTYAEESVERKRQRIYDVVTELQHCMPTPDATITEIVSNGSCRGLDRTENLLLPTVNVDEKKRSSFLDRLAKLEGETMKSSLYMPDLMDPGLSPKTFGESFHMGSNLKSLRGNHSGKLWSSIRKPSLNCRPVRPRRVQSRDLWGASERAQYSSQRAAELSAEVRAWKQVDDLKENSSIWSRPPLSMRSRRQLRPL